jgi:DNA-binding NtrC family response regulator
MLSAASVLILDADPRLRSALNANYLRHGWQVKAVGSFAEAMRLIDQHSFDLVVSGLGMRDGDGHRLMVARGGNMPATPVIVLTSCTGVADIVAIMRAGAFDVLARDAAFEVLQGSSRSAVGDFAQTDPGHPVAGGSAARYSCLPHAATGMTLSQLNRKHLEDALTQAEGNRTGAAKVLGISVRTVRNKIKQYGLPPRS